MGTSESVSEGHPDKISDLISDTVVDIMINKDPYSRVACETLVTTNKVVIAGEYRLDVNKLDLFNEIDDKIRLAVKKIGYEQSGFHWEKMKTFSIINLVTLLLVLIKMNLKMKVQVIKV